MIEINLLPDELKKRKRAEHKIDVTNINLEKVPLIKILIFVAGAILAVQVIFFGIGIFGKIMYYSIDKSYNKILPNKQEADRLKKDISAQSKKIAAIDELMVKRFSWSEKLNYLSNSMTPGIWLTQLEYDEKTTERPKVSAAGTAKPKENGENKVTTEKVITKYLIISGAASSMGEEGTALIGRFIKNLKENPSFYADFSDIELGAIKREQVSGQEIMTFKITCLFKAK